MKQIEIQVLTPTEAADAFATAWHRVEAGGEVTPRLAFGSLRELFSAISAKRLDLLRYVAMHEGLNVRQLAHALRRDYKNVHTDVVHLEALGLLTRDEDGSLTAPYDEILIHAELRAAA
jgi:predicted transcriptional regulator